MKTHAVSAIGKAPCAAMVERSARSPLKVLMASSLLAVALVLGAVPAWSASFLERAQQYFEEGDFSSAAVELKNALQRNPDNASARFLLGKVHLKLGDSPSAEKEFQRARELGYADQELDLMLAKVQLLLGRLEEVTRAIPDDLTLETAMQRDLFVARGEALIGLGQFDEAQAIFDRVLVEEPHPRALTNKARIAMILGDSEAARTLLDRALRVDPKDPMLIAVDGDWLLRARRFEEAKQRFAEAVELDPTRLPAHLGRVQAHLALGELVEADQIVQELKALQRDNLLIVLQDSIVRFLRGEYRGAKTAADRALAAADSQPQALFVAGHSAYQLGEYEQARAKLSAFLDQFPQNSQVRLVLGQTMLRLGHAEDALRTLNEAGDTIPDNTDYLSVLTSAALSAGDRAAGLRNLERLAARVPEDAEVQLRLGAVRQSMGDIDGSVEAIERAIALDPDRLDAYARLFAARIQQRRTAEALEIARRVQSRFPDQGVGETMLGIAHTNRRELTDAREAFQRALEREPDNIVATSNLVVLLRSEGKRMEALALLDRVLDTNPGDLRVLLMAADLATEAKDNDLAEEYLHQAIDQNPEAAQPRIDLGNYYLATDRPAQSLALVEPVLASNPNSLGLLETIGRARERIGDWAGELEAFEALSALLPNNARAQEYLMWALERNGRIVEALQAAERTLALEPSVTRARFAQVRYLAQLNRLREAKDKLGSLKTEFPEQLELLQVEGRIALAEGRNDVAVELYRKTFALRRTNFVLRELVKTLVATGRGEEGLAPMREWLNEYPNDHVTRTTLAETYVNLGLLQEAEEQYEVILSASPDRVGALNDLAWIQMTLGRSEEAMPLARRAFALVPGDPDVADTLALILLEVGEEQEALDLLKGARETAVDDTGIHFHFARALAANGLTDGAVSELRALLGRDRDFPQRPQAEALLARLTQ